MLKHKIEKYFRPVVSAGGHTIKEMKRRVRVDKLLFGILGITTWKVEKLHNGINEKEKCKIVKKNVMNKCLVMSMVI